MSLKVDWCSHKAAKYAVENWHYSRILPYGKLIKIGVWENEKFIGVIIYSRGANAQIGDPYGLRQYECCELTRVALREHETPVSQVLAKSFKMVKKFSPRMRLIISYADSGQGHHGGIYQATNWIYEGEKPSVSMKINGRYYHPRSVSTKYGTSRIDWLIENVDKNAKLVRLLPKHKYLMPLDKKMRKRLIKLHKPYPKKSEQVGEKIEERKVENK